jgi:cytohesin
MFDELLKLINRGDENGLRGVLTPDNVNAADEDGRTLLMHSVLAELGESCLPILLESNADPNVRDAHSWTALHFAARDGKTEAVERLLAAGAEVDPKDNDGCTPLWRAVMANSPLDVLTALSGAGADPDSVDKHGSDSPRSLADLMGYDEALDLFG